MTATSMRRMVLLAVVAASAMALVVQHYRGDSAVDTQAAAPPVSASASSARDQAPANLAAPPAKTNAAVAALAGSALPPQAGEGLPVFDIARVEPTGDAVIAGRATPGATVELLRNGELHDRAVADQSGQFVMVPPRLPSGTYDLTLRSKQPYGKQATSEQSVAVAIEPSATNRAVVAARAEVPFNVPDTVLSAATASKTPNIAAAQRPQLAAAGVPVLPDGGLPSTVVVPKLATTTVSRGDSLWRLSRFTYGAGTRYAVIYKANREQIRNPNLIHPGQIFVLPAR
jgi:nucleoid-associated protein YgaU